MEQLPREASQKDTQFPSPLSSYSLPLCILQAFSKFISSLRSPISKALQPEDGYSTPPSSTPLPTNTLYAPTFSHSSKDPIQRNLTVLPSHRIVIIEGLYCNLNQGEWRKAAETFDFRIVSLLDREVARERLRVRHVATGVAKDDQEAIWRGECWFPTRFLSLSLREDWRDAFTDHGFCFRS